MTKTLRVDVREQPELYESLKAALETGISINGWQVTQCAEAEADGVLVYTFLLMDCAVC